MEKKHLVWRGTGEKALDSNPDVDEIEDALSGNFCRCTGYKKIVEAVQDAGERLARGDKNESR